MENTLKFAVCLAALVTQPVITSAADLEVGETPVPAYPNISGSLDIEIAKDKIYRSDDPDNEIYDANATVGLAFRMGLADGIAINTGLTLEPVLEGEPGEDLLFQAHGVYVDTLNLELSSGPVTVVLGKFGPGFGTAWDNTPGIYGTTFAEDYEIAEMMGVGLAFELGSSPFGDVTFGANVFHADHTALSRSWGHDRGQLMVSDGGAGNTGSLDSYSFTLDGANAGGVEGLSWHLGYRVLAGGEGDLADEHGMAGGFAYETEVSPNLTMVVTGEAAHFSGHGGTSDDTTYFTGGAGLVSGPWHLEAAGGARNVDVDGGPDFDDRMVQVSGGYTFANEWDLSIGWARFEVEDVTDHIVGARLTREIEF